MQITRENAFEDFLLDIVFFRVTSSFSVDYGRWLYSRWRQTYRSHDPPRDSNCIFDRILSEARLTKS